MKTLKVQIKIKNSVYMMEKEQILRAGKIPASWDSLEKLEEAEAAVKEISEELQSHVNSWDELGLMLQAAIHKWREDEVT